MLGTWPQHTIASTRAHGRAVGADGKLDLRWPCLVLALLAGLAWWNGLRAARDRHEMLQPRRVQAPIVLPHAELLSLAAARDEALLLALPTDGSHRPLVLHQVFPERRLLRWLEAGDASGSHLYLPLRGLDPGEYWLSESEAGAAAAPVEMDRPVERLQTLLKFELVAVSGSGPAGE